jgi:hypothetical protein
MRARVQWSVSKPCARAPWRSAWSMAASWVSDRRGAYPVGPALRSASSPPACHLACQRLTFGGPHRAGGRPRLGSGRRQTTPRPACGRLRTPGGQPDRGRCGGRRLVSYRHPARTPPILSSEGANLFRTWNQARSHRRHDHRHATEHAYGPRADGVGERQAAGGPRRVLRRPGHAGDRLDPPPPDPVQLADSRPVLQAQQPASSLGSARGSAREGSTSRPP